MDAIVRVANSSKDIEEILRFAEEAGVSSEGIDSGYTQFLIMTSADQKMIATIGIETIGNNAMLRTLIADAAYCTSQKLYHLFDVAIGTARTQGKQAVYFFTEARPDVFRRLGFSKVDKNDIPHVLYESHHFKKTATSEKANLLKSDLSRLNGQ